MLASKLKNRVFQREFAIWAVFLHLGALVLLPLYFSWAYLAFAFFLAALTAYSLGIFHHMYLSHSSFRAHPWLENIGVLLGTLSWRGPMAAPLRYVALHRVHHAYSDQDQDPHSPVHGIFHALIGWNWKFAPFFAKPEEYLPFAGRHRNKAWFLFLDRHVHSMQLVWAILLFLLGGSTGFFSEQGIFLFERAMGWMVYGVFAKTLFVVYLANLVDVVNHGFGYRNYDTKDLSTNSRLMAAVHLGGAISWHNNHHARPRPFSVRARWWEFDAHLSFLRLLERIGLVSEIKVLDETAAPEEKKLTDFLRQDARLAALMMAGRLAQLALPIAAFAVAANQPFAAQALLALILAPLAAVGLHNLALLGHEGTHFNLAKGKFLSSALGTFFSSMVPFHFNTGFAISHAAHHVWANTEKDPDYPLFSAYGNFWARLFQARRVAAAQYFRLTLRAAWANDLRLPGLTLSELQWLARFNLLSSAAFLGLYGWLVWELGAGFALFFGLSYGLTYLLSALRPYLEHAGTDSGKYTNSRTFASPWLDFVFGGINYHLAHHLYPRVPAYRIAAFHRWLEGQESFAQQERICENRGAELVRAAGSAAYGRRELAKPLDSFPRERPLLGKRRRFLRAGESK